MKPLKSLRAKLFFWYFTSLISITAFFYFAVHIYSLPYRDVFFFLLLLILSLDGFLVVKKLTDGLLTLSSKIKSITSKNLNEKVTGLERDDEIGELASSFNGLLDRLLDAFRRERQFIGDVAHELKTPLATQRTGIEVVLSKNRTNEEYKEALTEALDDNNRITTTLKNILDLAWSEAESAKVDKEMVDLSKTATDLLEIATKLASAKNVKIYGNIDHNVNISGSSDKLFRALLNIIDNAVKYTPPGGTVKIELKKRKAEMVFKVKDTGVGITKDDLPHIFDRFYRGEKGKSVSGAGLGLAIAQGIIQAHKGRIVAQSVVGKGTDIAVLFPR